MNFIDCFKIYYKYVIALLFAIVICLYSYPQSFDITRFVDYYTILKNSENFVNDLCIILFNTPDFIAKICIAFLAYLGFPAEVFFFSITFLTVFILFIYFEKFHLKNCNQLPSIYAYVIFTVCLPIAAILSGIRNIHAWSVVLFVFMNYYTTSKKNYHLLMYATFVHFSSFLFIPLLFFIDKFQKKSLIKILGVSFVMGCFLKIIIFLEVKKWMLVTPSAFSNKLRFYLDESVFLIQNIKLQNWEYLSFMIIYLYFPFIYLVYVISNKQKNSSEMYWCKIVGMYYMFFLFFPDILNRFTMLLNLIIINHVLAFQTFKYKRVNVFVIYLVVTSVLSTYLFSKNVYFS